jgi:protoporphyrinogen oxidase
VNRELVTKRCEIAILGAGPAGLGAAWELARHDRRDVIVVDRNTRPGGLARTEQRDGHRFDVGPHRFFTPNKEIDALWHEVLGADFRPVSRLTRIFYRNKFFLYPVSALDALPKMGPVQAAWALASYAAAALTRDPARATTFEEWVSAQFGRKLYESFFKTYTEKVWGIPCSEIGASWASQRIKGLDLWGVVKNAVGALGRKPKTLADEFDYPTLGAGQMYERMAERAAAAGHTFLLPAEVVGAELDGPRLRAVTLEGPGGRVRLEAGQFITTLPITRFLALLAPPPAPEAVQACRELYYRDHLTVNLVVGKTGLFPDQWIYVHAPEVQMARLANYLNFSPAMAGRPGTTPLSVEYFVFREDPLWARPDAELVALAVDELRQMKLLDPAAVEQGFVVRETDSYPTYYLGFEGAYARVQAAMDGLENVLPAGRGGMYKYNNMDHSLYSGLLAARNVLGAPGAPFDLWKINIDAEYHESASRGP